jgi:hypothetical protein
MLERIERREIVQLIRISSTRQHSMSVRSAPEYSFGELNKCAMPSRDSNPPTSTGTLP